MMKIVVGEGSCGIAAGAEKVRQALCGAGLRNSCKAHPGRRRGKICRWIPGAERAGAFGDHAGAWNLRIPEDLSG